MLPKKKGRFDRFTQHQNLSSSDRFTRHKTPPFFAIGSSPCESSFLEGRLPGPFTTSQRSSFRREPKWGLPWLPKGVRGPSRTGPRSTRTRTWKWREAVVGPLLPIAFARPSRVCTACATRALYSVLLCLRGTVWTVCGVWRAPCAMCRAASVRRVQCVQWTACTSCAVCTVNSVAGVHCVQCKACAVPCAHCTDHCVQCAAATTYSAYSVPSM